MLEKVSIRRADHDTWEPLGYVPDAYDPTAVSIRRADHDTWEHYVTSEDDADDAEFQSAGRITIPGNCACRLNAAG